MRHIDLFSGIAGFALAAKQVWGDDYHNLFFCEIDKYCQAVIKKNFGKESLIYEDIKTVTKEQFIKDTISRRLLYGQPEEEETEIRRQRKPSTGDGNGIYLEETIADSKGSGQLRTAQSKNNGEDSKRGRRHDPTHKNSDTNSNPDINGLQESGAEKQTSGGGQFDEITSNPDLRRCVHRQSKINSTEGHNDTFGKFIPDIHPSSLQCDLLTAGPPCQPASQAGQRKGDKDDRWLWDEMFKVIQEFKPTWCVIENVYGLVSLQQGVVFDSLLSKMEALGYEVQPFVIGAVGKNAPHKRYRVWFVMHSIHADNSKYSGCEGESCGIEAEPTCNGPQDRLSKPSDFNTPDPKHERHVGRGSTGSSNGNGIQESEQTGQEPRGATSRCGEEYSDVGNSESKRRVGIKVGEISERKSSDNIRGITNIGNFEESESETRENFTNPRSKRLERGMQSTSIPSKFDRGEDTGWEQDWFKVATEFCGVDVGTSVRVDGFELTKSQHRVERLKALGNAVVVPLVSELFRFIKQADENPLEDSSNENTIKYINIEDKGNRYMVTKDLRNYGVKIE